MEASPLDVTRDWSKITADIFQTLEIGSSETSTLHINKEISGGREGRDLLILANNNAGDSIDNLRHCV